MKPEFPLRMYLDCFVQIHSCVLRRGFARLGGFSEARALAPIPTHMYHAAPAAVRPSARAGSASAQFRKAAKRSSAIILAKPLEVPMKQLFTFLVAASLAISAVHAQTASCAPPGADDDFLGIQTIRLWPGDLPEAKGNTCDDIPTIALFEPRKGSETGSAVIILPGGAYALLVGDLEGREVADWFAARGFRAFILSYRLSSNGYLLPVPLLDARRPIQTVRARAADYHINPNRIVVIGFSAGGHLAALAGTQFTPGNPDADDPIDRASSRPTSSFSATRGSAPSPAAPRT